MIKIAYNTDLLVEMKKQQITQKELAEKTGINRTYLSKFLNGSYIPTEEQKQCIATSLNISPDKIFVSENNNNFGLRRLLKNIVKK